MQVRKALIVTSLLMHKICAIKYFVVFWKIFQQSMSKFWDMFCHNLPESY